MILDIEEFLQNEFVEQTYTEEFGTYKGLSRIVIKKFRVYYEKNQDNIIVLGILDSRKKHDFITGNAGITGFLKLLTRYICIYVTRGECCFVGNCRLSRYTFRKRRLVYYFLVNNKFSFSNDSPVTDYWTKKILYCRIGPFY
ncbi:hypothetical protein GCM10007063_00760 [Lentibacillus kapialis]|uniref:Uncharacterized protein n=1 Tax=Lentibacillus kapialis TaxID=340214 RepID=A0A917PKD3_9BACI|nr:hypothetical protein GCM10007063_00760 [Lentibacillus kapialis]